MWTYVGKKLCSIPFINGMRKDNDVGDIDSSWSYLSFIDFSNFKFFLNYINTYSLYILNEKIP